MVLTLEIAVRRKAEECSWWRHLLFVLLLFVQARLIDSQLAIRLAEEDRRVLVILPDDELAKLVGHDD